MKLYKLIMLALSLMIMGCKDKTEKVVELASETAEELHETTKPDSLNIIPIEHATMILAYKDAVIYVDPVGGPDLYNGKEKPTYVLVTDIHGDHMDPTTLRELDLSNAILIVPKAVAEKLPELTVKELVVMNNGENKSFSNLKLEAIPMYNLRKEALKFHEKGRGNGYVLTLDDKRIYISGDTEDIPEMRQLNNIDVAFVCMNLPYTMTVDSAASAVLDFKPKKVYPYHFRGTEGMSDVEKFKSTINSQNPSIEVVQLKWYE
jgi:L-ascorbate metabolism protein UlaG (beta-lactamase superfamily)